MNIICGSAVILLRQCYKAFCSPFLKMATKQELTTKVDQEDIERQKCKRGLLIWNL